MRLYLIAMLDEAEKIIENYELIQEVPFPLYKKGDNLVAITGIGKVNSAFVTSNVISNFTVDEIINIGFVGAFGDFSVGDYVLVSKAIYHDVDATMFGYKKGQVPKMPEYYISKNKNLSKLDDLSKSILYTGDYFMTESIDDNYIADMEATAIFQVAHRLNIPVLSVKVVSDIIGGSTHLEDYQEFEKVGSNNINKLYLKLEELLND